MILKHYLAAAVLATTALTSATSLTAKEVVVPRIYMYGFAASFNDTIVHFTEIQPVDSAWIDGKTKFLLGRENYSLQLRQYLTGQQLTDRTCLVVYDAKLSRLQKRYLKMRRLYAGDKKAKHRNDLRTIATGDFRFTTVNMAPAEEEEAGRQDAAATDSDQPKKKRKRGK